MDWDKAMKELRKLGEEGKLQLPEDIAPELRKVLFNERTGKIEERTISPKLKEFLLEMRGRGE